LSALRVSPQSLFFAGNPCILRRPECSRVAKRIFRPGGAHVGTPLFEHDIKIARATRRGDPRVPIRSTLHYLARYVSQRQPCPILQYCELTDRAGPSLVGLSMVPLKTPLDRLLVSQTLLHSSAFYSLFRVVGCRETKNISAQSCSRTNQVQNDTVAHL
jgi:hypothetical protein